MWFAHGSFAVLSDSSNNFTNNSLIFFIQWYGLLWDEARLSHQSSSLIRLAISLAKAKAVLPDQFSNCSCKEIILFIDLHKKFIKLETPYI